MKIFLDLRWFKGLRLRILLPVPRSLLCASHLPQDPVGQKPAPAGIRLIFHRTVAIPRREMAVIQDPDLHLSPSGFIQNNVHIMPPARPGKIGMRPALDAYSTDIGFINHLHIFPQHLLCFSMLPEERKDVIVCFSTQKLLQFRILRIHCCSPLIYASAGIRSACTPPTAQIPD